MNRDETPTPRETPMAMAAVSPTEELIAIVGYLQPLAVKALLLHARALKREQDNE